MKRLRRVNDIAPDKPGLHGKRVAGMAAAGALPRLTALIGPPLAGSRPRRTRPNALPAGSQGMITPNPGASALTEPCQWIDERRDALLAFTAQLVATPSPNPPGDERAVADVVCAELERLGLCGAQIAAKESHRPNVLYRLEGTRPGPTLMMCGHSDTKPVGDASQWRTDPLKPVIRDGRMFGLGTTDMKAAVAAMVYATAALKRRGGELAGDILLVVNADEERTMTFGSHYLATEHHLRADIALLGEPSGVDGPEFEFLHLLSRGISCFRITVRGTQMHSSLTDRIKSVNANVKLAQVLNWMHEHLNLAFEPHPLCSAPTVNLAVRMEGGVGYGVCPGVSEFGCDIRTLPGMTRARLASDVEYCLQQLRRHDPTIDVSLALEEPPLDWFEPTEVRSDHPFVHSLMEASRQVLGWRPRLSAFPGGTDAKNFQGLAGIPTIPSFGPGWLPLAHGPNECVGVEAIVQAAKIYALAARLFFEASEAYE